MLDKFILKICVLLRKGVRILANNKPIDKTKKSNIKCEHCKWWHWCKPNGDNDYKCHNSDSPKYNVETNYWNRCKSFEWR